MLGWNLQDSQLQRWDVPGFRTSLYKHRKPKHPCKQREVIHIFTPEQTDTLVHAAAMLQQVLQHSLYQQTQLSFLLLLFSWLCDQRSTGAKPASFAAHCKMYEEVSKALTGSHLYWASFIVVLRECSIPHWIPTLFFVVRVLFVFSVMFASKRGFASCLAEILGKGDVVWFLRRQWNLKIHPVIWTTCLETMYNHRDQKKKKT